MNASSSIMLAVALLACAYALPGEETYVEETYALVESQVDAMKAPPIVLSEEAAMVDVLAETEDSDDPSTATKRQGVDDVVPESAEGYIEIKGLPKILTKALDHLLEEDLPTYEKVTTELMKHEKFLVDLETFEELHPGAASLVNEDALKHAGRLVGMIGQGTRIFKEKNLDSFEDDMKPSKHSNSKKKASKEAAKAATMLTNKWEAEWKQHQEDMAHVPHPGLVHTIANTKPHKWQDVFTSRQYGLKHLLSLPFAKIECEQAVKLFADKTEEGQTLKLRVPDVRGHEARIGRTHLVNAEVIQLQGDSATSADAKIVLLLREHRLRTKSHTRIKHKFIEGSEVAIDADRDVIMEAAPHLGAQGECHRWYVRHPKEGTDALAKMLEENNRKGLAQLLKPLTNKMNAALHKAGALKTVTGKDGTKKHVLADPHSASRDVELAQGGKGGAQGGRTDTMTDTRRRAAASPPPPAPATSVGTCAQLADQGHSKFHHWNAQQAYDMVKGALKAGRCPSIDSHLPSSVSCPSSRRRNVSDADFQKRKMSGFKGCCDCMKRTVGYAAINERMDRLHPAWYSKDPEDPPANEQQCVHGSCSAVAWRKDLPHGEELVQDSTKLTSTGGKGGPKFIEVPTEFAWRITEPYTIAQCTRCNCLPECTEFAEQCYEVGGPRPRGCTPNGATTLKIDGGHSAGEKSLSDYRHLGEEELLETTFHMGGKGDKERWEPPPPPPTLGLNKYTDKICCALCNSESNCEFWYHNGHICYLRAGQASGYYDPSGMTGGIPNPAGVNAYRGDFKHPQESYDGPEVAAMRTECKHEDEKDINCIKDAVMAWYANDICMGASCSLAENQVTSVIFGIIIYIVDSLLGCALSFLAQPSFWIGMTGAQGGADETAQAATVASEANGIREAGAESMEKGEQAMGRQMAIKNNQRFSTKIKNGIKEAGKKAKKMGAAARGINPTTVKNFMKKGFRNYLPCLPAALLAWIEGGTSFFACMGWCMAQAIGESIASLVFRLVKDCLWRMIKEAMEEAFSCFPADATVQLSSGQETTMRQLQVGDRVLTKDGSYSEVYLLSHQNPNVIAKFVTITMENAQHIDATARHFVYTSPKCDGSVEQIYASAVKEGMCMFTQSHAQARQQLLRVASVTFTTKTGVYNPFTMEGSIVVNGIVASSHSDWFLDGIAQAMGVTSMLPSIYQATLLPARGLYHLVGPQVARRELEKYQPELEMATESGWVVKPYWDLFQRAIMIILGARS